MNTTNKRNRELTSIIYSNVILFVVNAIAYAITLIDTYNGGEVKAFTITVILTTIPVLINILNTFVVEEIINGIKKIVYLIIGPITIIYIIIAFILLYADALSVIRHISIIVGVLPIGESLFNVFDAFIELRNTK